MTYILATFDRQNGTVALTSSSSYNDRYLTMINSNLLILPDKDIIIRICGRRENAENQAATQ